MPICSSIHTQETFKIKESEEIAECKESNKTECVFLKKNYNSIDLTEVEQIDEYVDEINETVKEQYRPPIGPILTQVNIMNIEWIFVVFTHSSAFNFS